MLNVDSTGCISYDGCEFKDEGFSNQFCQKCYAYKFNNSTENSTSCKSCETDYDFDTLNTGKQWDSTDDSRGNSECPWICTDNWYKSGNSCVHCPDGATSPAGSDDVTDCQCPTGAQMVQINGVYTCITCPDNASFDGNTCKCNAGYYGDINTCTACPYGTTSAAGATTASDCHMTQNTKFCDANGENCMKLLSGANNINQ